MFKYLNWYLKETFEILKEESFVCFTKQGQILTKVPDVLNTFSCFECVLLCEHFFLEEMYIRALFVIKTKQHIFLGMNNI